MASEPGSYVYIDPKESEIDTEELTPEGKLEKIKREAIAEFLAAQAAAAGHNSSSEQKQLLPGTSATVSPVAVESVSVPSAPLAGHSVKATK